MTDYLLVADFAGALLDLAFTFLPSRFKSSAAKSRYAFAPRLEAS
jgi:hypothetical protein